jgi:short-chain fatty acids transporter
MRNLIRNTAEKWHFAMEKVMPDSFIFAVLLTFIVFILALTVVQASPIKIVDSWYRGFWAYLGFSMQMVVLLIFGYSLAITRLGARAIDAVTGIAKTPAGAVAVVAAAGATGTEMRTIHGILPAGLPVRVHPGCSDLSVFADVKISHQHSAPAGFR